MASETLKQELDRYLKQHPETRFLEPLMPDINGVLRGKRLGLDDFDKAFTGGLNVCGSTPLLDTQGNAPESIPYGANDGDPDVLALAVPGSLAPVPWVKTPTAQVLLESCAGPCNPCTTWDYTRCWRQNWSST